MTASVFTNKPARGVVVLHRAQTAVLLKEILFSFERGTEVYQVNLADLINRGAS